MLKLWGIGLRYSKGVTMSEIGRSINDELRLAAYKHNHQHFRALNALMWQVPLIGVTLTGGLWFGVSRVTDSHFFQTLLLIMATIGDACLGIMMIRIRYIMGEYLVWIKNAYPDGCVEAPGNDLFTRSKIVRTLFQVMLFMAAFMSLIAAFWIQA